MPTLHDELKTITETIKKQRDEASLQMHLAKEDINDELEELEKSWDQLIAKMAEVRHETENAGKDILESAKELGNHIKEGYDKIKSKI